MGTIADAKNTAIGSTILAGIAFALIPAIYQAIKTRMGKSAIISKLLDLEESLDSEISKIPYPSPNYRRDLWDRLLGDKPERKFESASTYDEANEGGYGSAKSVDDMYNIKKASTYGFLTDLFSAAKSDWLLASKLLLSFVLADKLTRFAIDKVSKDMIRQDERDKTIKAFEKMEEEKMKDMIGVISGKSRIDDYDIDREWLEAEGELEGWNLSPDVSAGLTSGLSNKPRVTKSAPGNYRKSMVKSSWYLGNVFNSMLNSDIAAILGNLIALALTANALKGLREGFYRKYRTGMADEKLSEIESNFEEAKAVTPEFGLMKLRSIDFGKEVEKILKSREKAVEKLRLRKNPSKKKVEDKDTVAGISDELFEEKDIYKDRFV